MAFWKRAKNVKSAVGREKDTLIIYSVAVKLPHKALPDLIRAIVRPLQSDLLLAVAEEGTDARPDMTPYEFFFGDLIKLQSSERMKENERNSSDYPLSLAIDMVLPWPWSYQDISTIFLSQVHTRECRGSRTFSITMLIYGCPGELALYTVATIPLLLAF